MGSLLAKLIDVPIDLTQTLENIVFILRHTEAKALIVSNLDLLCQVVPFLWTTTTLKAAIVAHVPPGWQQTRLQLDGRQHAQRYELGKRPQGRYALMLKLADRLVFSQWRSVFGNRLKYLICGVQP